LRDYLYIPLGGNRKGPRRRDLNLLATMTLGGLWHGASFSFAIWGLYHGLLLGGSHRLESGWGRLGRRAGVPVTFLLVTIGWVFFRMRTVTDTLHVFRGMLGLHGAGDFPGHLLIYVLISGALMWGTREEWSWPLGRWGVPRLAAAAVVVTAAVMSLQNVHPFIYFKF
jgi:alginate O-acetyltransferase complex protein AlgI